MKAELGGLRARQLKQRLDELKVDTSSCFDRDSLEKLLVVVWLLLVSILPLGVRSLLMHLPT